MTKETIDGYKNKLQRERLLVIREIKDLEKPIDFGNDIDHFDEKTDEVEEKSNQFGQENDLKKRLDEIDNTLQKIEMGHYGACESCGRDIEKEILDIDPESRLCKSCKTNS
jgi:DnaK suppressor protein